MGLTDDARTILRADASLMAVATGDVWTFEETGRLGLNRTNVAAVFDAKGRLMPCVLLKERETIPDYEASDEILQAVSARAVLEVWLYCDVGFAPIDEMAGHVYRLLHTRRLTTGDNAPRIMHWMGNVRPPIRDTDLDAHLQRCDYRVRFINRPSA